MGQLLTSTVCNGRQAPETSTNHSDSVFATANAPRT